MAALLMPRETDHHRQFESALLPHLGAACTLVRCAPDAEDLVRESYLRAWRYFDTFRGGEGRPWLLRTVRNTCYEWLPAQRLQEPLDSFDDAAHPAADVCMPEARLLHLAAAGMVNNALECLPGLFRETVVLRECEDLSYREIVELTATLIGTVMSRLARGRRLLAGHLTTAHHNAGGAP